MISVVGPVQRQRGVAHDLQDEEDDVVLVEDEVEGEPEPKEIQLLGIFAERDWLFLDDVEAAAAELRTRDASAAETA